MDTVNQKEPGWRSSLDRVVHGITKQSKERKDARFVRMVVGRLKTLTGELEDWLSDKEPTVMLLPSSIEAIGKIKPLLDEDPAMTTREIRRRSGCSLTTIVKYRRRYREKHGLPPLGRGPKPKFIVTSKTPF
jgi:hypothetical protein